jgi:GNAT superfamily N-acetyltransferase
MRYFRRFRMVFEFAERHLPEPTLPLGFHFVEWKANHIGRHAATKFECFRDEVDSQVFPCLAAEDGCLTLMEQIAGQKSFCPEATWLVTHASESGPVDCGVIQGLANSSDAGSIQNVGVAKTFRGLGLGRALILKNLHGFRELDIRRVYLEATAENIPAVELYRSIGFRLIRTTFKQVSEEAPASWGD